MDKKILRTLAVLTVGIGLNAVTTNPASAEQAFTRPPVAKQPERWRGGDDVARMAESAHSDTENWRAGGIKGGLPSHDLSPCSASQMKGICADSCRYSNGTINTSCYDGCLPNAGQYLCPSDTP